MTENPYVTQLKAQLQMVLVDLAPLPDGCNCRWAPWTGRSLRRSIRAVQTAAAALYRALDAADTQGDERAHAFRLGVRLLRTLPTARAVPDAARYIAIVTAWLPGLSAAETKVLCHYFACRAASLAQHITNRAFGRPMEDL